MILKHIYTETSELSLEALELPNSSVITMPNVYFALLVPTELAQET